MWQLMLRSGREIDDGSSWSQCVDACARAAHDAFGRKIHFLDLRDSAWHKRGDLIIEKKKVCYGYGPKA